MASEERSLRLLEEGDLRVVLSGILWADGENQMGWQRLRFS
jgi:hypothetical protein